MNAVERLRHYGNNLLKEKAWEVEGSVPDSWPSQGTVDFEMVQMKCVVLHRLRKLARQTGVFTDGGVLHRYRAKLEPALNNFSAHIDDKEKIGVAGRTGSGKRCAPVPVPPAHMSHSVSDGSPGVVLTLDTRTTSLHAAR